MPGASEQAGYSYAFVNDLRLRKMSLSPRLRQQIVHRLESYEGRVNHLYLDTVGKVTVGVGHLIPYRGAISRVDLYTVWNGVTGSMATFSEKQDEYDRVSAQPAGYRASWYRSATRLVMLDTTISRLRDEHVDTFHRELRAIYARKNGFAEDFDGFPETVQAALFDLIFNLGASRLMNTFPRFNQSIRASDWRTAAKESHRPQVSAERNRYVHQLFLSAAGIFPACAPAC